MTLRFYADDPETFELYERLRRRRQETGVPMTAITMEALKAYFDGNEHQANAQVEAMRGILRTELRAALREWAPVGLAASSEPNSPDASDNVPSEEDYDPDSIRAALAFSL